ncbi:MAG: pilus assembly protein [Actinobacteria bacterium]|nr:pilus assembly protein [Actinomycetota bacterium]
MRWRVGDDRGQAAVELALVLPLVAALALALLQVALVVRDQVLVVHAAREGARAAAVSDDPGAAQAAALAGASLIPDRVVVEASGRGEAGSRVRVLVRYVSVTDLPLVGPLVGDVELSGSASMRVER